MSTRSAIIEKTETGYRGIYAHSDGYLAGVGRTLLENYMDPAKVSALIDLGDISSLGERVKPISPNHTFDNSEEGTTVAYTRDRGETNCEPTVAKTIRGVANKIDHNGYVYVFENGKWTRNGKDFSNFKEDKN
jgi:hypothetical protein